MESISYKSIIKKTFRISVLTACMYIIPLIVGMTVMYYTTNTTVLVNKSSFFDIVYNNLLAITINMSGIFTFGITTIINLLINGFVHGLAIRNYFDSNGVWNTLIRILPHGLFEIPAIIFSGAVGVIPLIYIFYYIINKKIFMGLKQLFKYIFIMIIVSYSFIFIGAIIETFLFQIL